MTVGGTADLDVYHESGKVESFSGCTGGACNVTFEPACTLSVRAASTDFRGFIL